MTAESPVPAKVADAKRVLVIDDDPGVRNFLKLVLEVEGYEVMSETDGMQALAAQRRQPAAIVVTDIFMPHAEGIETIVKLRAEFPQTGIIVMSGGGTFRNADYLKVARELGAAKALRKPFSPQELIDAVREVERALEAR